jgi:hypothetical protein
MASALGLDELHAHLLNTVGLSRATLGDTGGLEDIERSIEISRRINSPELIRGFGNLSSIVLDLGELARSTELLDQAISEAERFGTVMELRWLRGERAIRTYFGGDWDGMLRQSERLLVDEHFIQSACHAFRAKILVGRDDPAAADAESRRSLELARKGEDPQLLHPGLAAASWTLAATGHRSGAEQLVDELLSDWETRDVLASAFWLVDLADVLLGLGREADFDRVAEQVRLQSRWVEAARSVAAGDFLGAAEVFAAIGSVPDEAYARLNSGVEAEVRRALDFYQMVGAARYVREGEAMLARTA